MSNLLDNINGSYRVKYPSGNIDTTIEGYSPTQIKAELAGLYKELENATLKITNVGGVNTVEFVLPSGQKNA